jgi:hypothetical protein
VRTALQRITEQQRPGSDNFVSTVLDYASRYLFDAEWYLQRGDCLTALACRKDLEESWWVASSK